MLPKIRSGCETPRLFERTTFHDRLHLTSSHIQVVLAVDFGLRELQVWAMLLELIDQFLQAGPTVYHA